MKDTFATDIEAAVHPEIIEAVVIAEFTGYPPDEKYGPANAVAGRVLTWKEARPLLDYEFDSSYGGQECHDIALYTASRVFWVHEYDGSTQLRCLPRNPTEGDTGGWPEQ